MTEWLNKNNHKIKQDGNLDIQQRVSETVNVYFYHSKEETV